MSCTHTYGPWCKQTERDGDRPGLEESGEEPSNQPVACSSSSSSRHNCKSYYSPLTAKHLHFVIFHKVRRVISKHGWIGAWFRKTEMYRRVLEYSNVLVRAWIVDETGRFREAEFATTRLCCGTEADNRQMRTHWQDDTNKLTTKHLTFTGFQVRNRYLILLSENNAVMPLFCVLRCHKQRRQFLWVTRFWIPCNLVGERQCFCPTPEFPLTYHIFSNKCEQYLTYTIVKTNESTLVIDRVTVSLRSLSL